MEGTTAVKGTKAMLRCSRVQAVPAPLCQARGGMHSALQGVMVNTKGNTIDAACTLDEDTELGRSGAPRPRLRIPRLCPSLFHVFFMLLLIELISGWVGCSD